MPASTHFDPATRGTDRTADWDAAVPFEPWLAAAEDLVELWTSAYGRASADPAMVARAEDVVGEWKLIVLTEDWCRPSPGWRRRPATWSYVCSTATTTST